MSNLTIEAFFTKSGGLPAEGLALADIDFYLTRQNVATGVDSVVWDGTQNPTEEIDNCGAYTRIYADANLDVYTYTARASYTGATDLDVDHVTGVVPEVNPWQFGIRTLSQVAASVVAAVTGARVAVYRTRFWSVTLTSCSFVNPGRVILSVKERPDSRDSEAIVRISSDVGLERLNGSTINVWVGDGSLSYDAGAGTVTFTLRTRATSQVRANDTLTYDVEEIGLGGEVHSVTGPGVFSVLQPVGRITS